MEELLGRLRLDGVAVAAVRAVEADHEEEWSGIRGLARSGLLEAAGLAAAPASALAVFADALPEWADRFPHLNPNGEPLSYARALSEILRAATEEQPIALAIDDAQWLDPASMQGLRAVLRDLESTPFILLFATDSHPPRAELDALLDWLKVGSIVTHEGRELDDVAILDLPDIDSVRVEHRATVDALLPRIDAVTWVVDPEKYDDERLHGYLRSLAPRARVLAVARAARRPPALRPQQGGPIDRCGRQDGRR